MQTSNYHKINCLMSICSRVWPFTIWNCLQGIFQTKISRPTLYTKKKQGCATKDVYTHHTIKVPAQVSRNYIAYHAYMCLAI